ncbi:MAG TPA: reverse transcriptase-like protein [Candidatus Saccharimonadales bacterium]|nr:reverse transcriptase-like protein [Candidatus Saccharimonadales bacterium]
MKTLKLEHELANLVVKGEKTSTWRMYDDKDLQVDDDISLIDKVDPDNRATWRTIGTAHIDEVVQKRLGDLDEADLRGHEQFSSPREMLETYRKYYGPSVSLQTTLKIIRFTFTPAMQNPHLSENEDKKTTKLTEVKVFADGGSRGNPGPSASGFVVMNMKEKIIVKQGIYLGVTTNNQAEYQALKFALEEAKRLRVQTVHVYMDSLLVINQMLGIFRVKNRDLWPIHDAVKQLAAGFKKVTYTQVPRAFNRLADAAVNEALDASAEAQNYHQE